jgi:hypothetical protein
MFSRGEEVTEYGTIFSMQIHLNQTKNHMGI